MSGDRTEPEAGRRVEELLGSLEHRVMDDLWAHGESRVGDVLERLNTTGARPLAYNTVMSVMARLADKGYLKRHRSGRAYVYTPTATRDGFLRERANEAAAQIVDDFGDLAVSSFVESVRDRPDLLHRLEQLITDHDRRQSGG